MGDRFLEPDEGNPGGYFEDLDFLELHRRFLSRSEAEAGRVLEDSSMREVPFCPGLVEADWERARRLVDERGKPGEPWGWKDPRTCYFLSFWHELVPRANYPVIYRHPLEVGASLLRMGKNWDCLFDPLFPLRAWTFSMREVLRFLVRLPGERFLVFGAESMWAAPEDLAEQLGEQWQLPVSVATLLEIRRPKARVRRHAVSRRQHAVFARYFPEAAETFEALREQTAAPVPMPETHSEADPTLDFLESCEVAPELAIQLLYDSIHPDSRARHHEARQGMVRSAKAYLRERFREEEAIRVAHKQQAAYVQDLLQALDTKREKFLELLEHSKKQKEHIAKLSEFIDNANAGRKEGGR